MAGWFNVNKKISKKVNHPWVVWIEEEWDDMFYLTFDLDFGSRKISVHKMACRYEQACENCDKPAVWSWRSKADESAYYDGTGQDNYRNILFKNLCNDCDFILMVTNFQMNFK